MAERALERECETIQFFSRNPRGWRFSALKREDVAIFRKEIAESGIFPVFVHMPYLPNLATSEEPLRTKSLESLCDDLKRAGHLGAQFLILHVGSRKGVSPGEAVENMAAAVNRGLERVKNQVILLLENTAGMGSELGSRFEEIGQILDRIDDGDRVGICFDTAHAYEAGYDVSTEEGLEATLMAFDELIGLTRIRGMHVNDSKTALGSRVDRHWHIGDGFIGTEAFRRIVNHPEIQGLPGIMETPRTGLEDDMRNMRLVKSLRAA